MTIRSKSILAIISLFLFMTCGSNESQTDSAAAAPSNTVNPSEETTNKEAPKPQTNATSVDPNIIEIKTMIKVIDSKLDSYERRILDVRSSDGTPMEVIGYYNTKGAVKITTKETKSNTETNQAYYLKDNKLAFAVASTLGKAASGSYAASELRTYISNGNVIQMLEKKGDFKTKEEANLAAVENVDITNEDIGKKALLGYEVEVKKWRGMMEPQ